MDKLNHDCIAEILQYVPFLDRIRCERVNKLWKEASQSSWRSFRNLEFKYLLTSTNIFKENRKKCSNKNLIFHEFLKRSGRFLKTVDVNIRFSRDIQQINTLDLSVVIQYLSIYCENLEELTITGNSLEAPDILLTPLFHRNKNLKKLEINFSKLNGTCLLYVPSTLEFLTLKGIYMPIALKLPHHFKNLKVFELLNDDFDILVDMLDDGFNIITYSDELGNLNSADDKSDHILRNLSEGLISPGSNIAVLVIRGAIKVIEPAEDTKALIKLLSGMKNLEYLEVGNFCINNDVIMSISKVALETIILESCKIDLNFAEIDKSAQTFSYLKNLEAIDMNIDSNFVNFISLCKNLTFLKLDDYEFKISLKDFNKLFENLQNLEVLNLSAIYSPENFDDEHLKIIGENCKFLKAINLTSCGEKSVTDNGLSYITSIENLEILSTNCLRNINGESLKFMPNIRELYCHKNINLKNDGLIELLKTAPYLERLDVSGCKKINDKLIDEAIKTVAVRKQNLRIFIKDSGIKSRSIKNVPTSVILKNKVSKNPRIFFLE